MSKNHPEYLNVLNMGAIKNIVDGEGNPFQKSDSNGPYYIEKSFRLIRDSVAEEQFERIKKAFGICYDKETMNIVKERFMDVVTGAGNEWMEINQLNSSALLSFLCFHAVGIGGRTVTIDGTIYNDVKFEFKSSLKKVGKTHPVSNMDVVLLNGGDKKALFLESKFTEHMKQTTRPLKISSYYNTRYAEEEVFGKTSIDLRDDSHTHFEDSSWKADEPVYLEGVKQMVCHYLGMTDQLRNRRFEEDWSCLKEYEEFALGEIVFDFNDNDGKTQCYKNTYKALSSFLKENCRIKGMTVLENILTYQNEFKANVGLLEDNVKKFYGL